MRRITGLLAAIAAIAGVHTAPAAVAGDTDAEIAYVANAVWFVDRNDGGADIYDVGVIVYRGAGTTSAYARAFVSRCPTTPGVCPVVGGSARLRRIPASAVTIDPLLRRATLRARLGARAVRGTWTGLAGLAGASGAPYLCPPGALVGADAARTAASRVRMFGRTFTNDGAAIGAVASLDVVAIAEVNGSYDERTGYCEG